MKWAASGDQAKSYISAPLERHMCFARHDSLSSWPSLPKPETAVSLGTQRITFPSSPADARVSPVEEHRQPARKHERRAEGTFRGPSDNVDGLVVLGEGGEVLDLAVRAVGVDPPDTDVVVAA